MPAGLCRDGGVGVQGRPSAQPDPSRIPEKANPGAVVLLETSRKWVVTDPSPPVNAGDVRDRSGGDLLAEAPLCPCLHWVQKKKKF